MHGRRYYRAILAAKAWLQRVVAEQVGCKHDLEISGQRIEIKKFKELAEALGRRHLEELRVRVFCVCCMIHCNDPLQIQLELARQFCVGVLKQAREHSGMPKVWLVLGARMIYLQEADFWKNGSSGMLFNLAVVNVRGGSEEALVATEPP